MQECYTCCVDLVTHLRTFCEVAAEHSVTRAAQNLGIPQPVASRRIGTLERHLGGRLLVRGARGVTLSDLGTAVLPHASALVARSDHLLEVARTFHRGLVLAVPAGADARGLVAVRAAGRRVGADVSVAADAPDGRAARLRQGTASLSLVACPPDEAALAAPLGVAAGEAAGVRAGAALVHLDGLRRRHEPGERARLVHVGVEDDVPWVRDPLRRRATRCGLAPAQVVVGADPTAAVADALEHGDLLLATPHEAQRHGLGWWPLGGLALWRGYRVVAAPGDPAASSGLPAEVQDSLAAALGLDPVPVGTGHHPAERTRAEP